MELAMKKVIIIGLLLIIALPCLAENYLLNGGQASEIRYKMVQELQPAPGIRYLVISYVIPQNFESPSYNQKILGFEMTFSTKPKREARTNDIHGNQILKAIWMNPEKPILATVQFTAVNFTTLKAIETQSPFPVNSLPDEAKTYLASTRQVPADHPEVVRLSKKLTASSSSQIDAVQSILTWVIDNLNYVLVPESYDAMYSMRTGKGNCQNFSHVAAALMRAAGIPVRIVNGVTLKEAFDIKMRGGTLTMRMAQGRHSWVEVFFPDHGWIPFDPQQMQLFVSNRFIRVETGLDNAGAVNDGTVQWTWEKGNNKPPKFQETIEASLLRDNVTLTADKQKYGPRKMLFTPAVEASFSEMALGNREEASAPVVIQDLNAYTFREPAVFGNLEFPENVDFLGASGPVESADDTTMMIRKNFLVETAEYVTGQGQKYAQTFLVQDPVQVDRVGLALHKFGGSGQLWVELLRDDGDGKPGEMIETSPIRSSESIAFSPGYVWEDFTFTEKPVILAPGRYWMTFCYTGSPIINWFFTYGKPVGPPDGTRYNTMFDETWSRNLTYEFNYRITARKGAR